MTRRLLACLVFVTLLSACGSGQQQQNPLATIRGALSSVLPSGNDAPPPDLRSQITPQAIAESETPVLFIEVPSQSAQAVLTPTGQNGRVRTWATADAIALSLDSGLLTATRGLPVDMVSANLVEVRQGIAGTRGQGARIHRYLDANEQLYISSFVCDYTRARGRTAETLAGRFTATLVVEDCIDSRGRTFVNRFWIDGAGLVRKSEQWVSPEVGSIVIELLKNR